MQGQWGHENETKKTDASRGEGGKRGTKWKLHLKAKKTFQTKVDEILKLYLLWAADWKPGKNLVQKRLYLIDFPVNLHPKNSIQPPKEMSYALT